MQQVSPSRVSIRFGAFEVDLRAGELRKQGVKVKLQEQPFQVLQILLEQPGEVVSREELQRQIWPGDTFVGFDQGLYNAVKRLREALGDTADTPRFIETLPKRGYRFIAAVNGNGHASIASVQEGSVAPAQESSVVPPVQETPPVAAIPATSRRWALWVGLAAVAVIVVFMVAAPGGVASNLRHWFSSGTTVPAIHSLAVLPLQNLSGDPAQEYFADGMTEELITELSGISALKVISRTSVMRYKKSDKSLPEIARELNVDAIVEGSVARSGNDVRITTQLIYAPQDKNVWARSYQSQVENSLTMQSQIASAITEAVRAQIVPGEQAHLQTARPVNPKAFEAYFQGNYHFSRYGSGSGLEETEKAVEYLRQAIAEDPGFALAYKKMAEVYTAEGILLPQARTVPLIKTAAEKALALDPNLSMAHQFLGNVKSGYDWDWQGAEREYKRAIELDPNNAWARESFGVYLISVGRMEEGLNEQQRAQELDPCGNRMSIGLYEARQYDRAIDLIAEGLEINPTDSTSRFWLSESYAQKGMYKEALQHLQLTLASFGLKEIAESMNRGYATAGYKGAMRDLAIGTEKLAIHGEMTPGYVARFYLRSGDKEQAVKWLQRDYDERADDLLTMLQVDPVWDPLRSDSKFKDLVRRVGLPQQVSVQETH